MDNDSVSKRFKVNVWHSAQSHRRNKKIRINRHLNGFSNVYKLFELIMLLTRCALWSGLIWLFSAKNLTGHIPNIKSQFWLSAFLQLSILCAQDEHNARHSSAYTTTATTDFIEHFISLDINIIQEHFMCRNTVLRNKCYAVSLAITITIVVQ